MSLKKILMKGTTRMSLHDRFTFLRNHSASEPSSSSVHIQAVRQGLFNTQQASAKNRRLAHMMDRRSTVIAALKLKKRILKQRLGVRPGTGLSVKERLTLRGRGRSALRGRIGNASAGRSPLNRPQINDRRGSLNRSHSATNLSRSQSMQSLNGRRNMNTRGGRNRGRYQNRSPYIRQEFRRRANGRGFQPRGGSFIRNRDDFRNKRGGNFGRFNNRGQRSRGFRSRGGRGGGGRRRGGGPMPTREELDSQLDRYMAGSRSVLDRDLDVYMQQEESWD